MATQAEKRARAIAALATLPTYAERLVLVKTAIDELLTSGQAVSYEGRSLSMANLSELRKLEIEYENKAAEELAPCAARSRIIYVTPVT
jgi:hypothetical protein